MNTIPRKIVKLLDGSVRDGMQHLASNSSGPTKFVKLFDVTLRDGIQNLVSQTPGPIFTVGTKLNMLSMMSQAGLKHIEIGSNVSQKIQEMKNSQDVLKSINFVDPCERINSTCKCDFMSQFESYRYKPGVLSDTTLCLMVPNYTKFIEAKNWINNQKVTRYSLITACSDSFIMKNTKMTLEKNLADIDTILEHKVKARLYISCCFGCPFEGSLNSNHIKNLDTIMKKYSEHPNVEEIVLSDTIGHYNIVQIDNYIQQYKSTGKLSLHIHSDDNDINIPEIIRKYHEDLVSIDTSLGNIGGCPNVDKNNIKPNLSTVKIAKILNEIYSQPIYDIKLLEKLDTNVCDIITAHQNNHSYI